MGKFVDLSGRRFDRLKVVEKAGHTQGGKITWLCVCDCGNTKIASGNNLKLGYVKSCGCLGKEISSARFRKHGERKTRIYSIWMNMKCRTNNPNYNEYERYGARGIKVCEEWEHDYVCFKNWAINNGYKDGLSIDRIDNDGNYEPSNCKWSNPTEQGRNKSNNVLIEYNGEIHCISEWAEFLNINYGTLYSRIVTRKWSIERAFNTPVK